MECNKTVHQRFRDFKEAHDGGILYNTAAELVIPMKLIGLIKGNF
jgi:hypothetical protein